MIAHPPSFNAVPIFRQRFRYVALSNRSQSFNFGNLCAVLSRAIAANTILPCFSAVRIKSVELWCPSRDSALPAEPISRTVIFRAYASQSSSAQLSNDEVALSDTSVGTAEPAHVRWVPRSGTALANWIGSGSTFYSFTIVAPLATVLDIELECRLDTVNNTNSISGAYTLTPGYIYQCPPDLSVSNWACVNSTSSVLA